MLDAYCLLLLIVSPAAPPAPAPAPAPAAAPPPAPPAPPLRFAMCTNTL